MWIPKKPNLILTPLTFFTMDISPVLKPKWDLVTNDMTQKVSYLELIMYTFKNVPSEL